MILSCILAIKMSDNYSDDDFEDTARDPEPMVVEVRGRGTKGSPVTARRSGRSTSATAHRRRELDVEEYNIYFISYNVK